MKIQNIARILVFGGALIAIVVAVGYLMPGSYASAAVKSPSIPLSGSPITGGTITTIITQIADWLVGIALVIALIMIVWGGVMWMWSRGDDTKAQDARKIILNGILVSAVVLAIGLILSTIQKIVQSPTNFIPK